MSEGPPVSPARDQVLGTDSGRQQSGGWTVGIQVSAGRTEVALSWSGESPSKAGQQGH